MARDFPKNKDGLKGKSNYTKHHKDMSEDEKNNISKCQGEKHGHLCKNPVFRCSECGNYGCEQDVLEMCTEQGFKNGKCLNCRVVGTQIPVMKDEFEKYVELWNNSLL